MCETVSEKTCKLHGKFWQLRILRDDAVQSSGTLFVFFRIQVGSMTEDASRSESEIPLLINFSDVLTRQKCRRTRLGKCSFFNDRKGAES